MTIADCEKRTGINIGFQHEKSSLNVSRCTDKYIVPTLHDGSDRDLNTDGNSNYLGERENEDLASQGQQYHL